MLRKITVTKTMDANSSRKRKPNPRQNANLLSILTFFFTIPLFLEGNKKELNVDDVYETLNDHKSSRMGDKLEAAWNVEKRNKNPSIAKALIRAFGLEYLMLGVPVGFNEIIVKSIPPICLAQLISYYSAKNGNRITEYEAYLYAVGLIGCSLLSVVIHHPYRMAAIHMGMKLRIACCSLIYRKTLKLSKRTVSQTNAGQLINLLSNDVRRFDYFPIYLHFLWVVPLQSMVAVYFMYKEAGISAIIGITTMLSFIPLQFFLGKLTSMYRRQIARKTDERVRLMNEIIMGIQIIKMYTWEKPFAKLVSLCRKNEMKLIRATSYIKGVNSSLTAFITRTALCGTILALAFFHNDVNAQQVYLLTCFFNIFRISMGVYFYQAIFSIAEVKVSIERLNKFFLIDEAEFLNQNFKPTFNSCTEEEAAEEKEAFQTHAVTVKNGTLKWEEYSKDNTLTNINLNIKRGRLVAVIGHVGCGKTSLLYGILKETPLTAGTLRVNGKISYASQDPWIFPSSAQQNIIFGKEMDKVLYNTIVEICALKKDFEVFPCGDKTFVGEKGVILSGGQRARINLARAIYREADIYLLDDPLSAVDTHVGKQIFENCISGYLNGKTVILITHQLQYLNDVDYIYVIEQGLLKAEGTFAQLHKSGLDFAKFLKSDSTETGGEPSKKVLLPQNTSVERKISNLSTSNGERKGDPQETEEQRSSGHISTHVYSSYINAGANCCMLFILLLLLISTQLLASLTDYFIAYWMNVKQKEAEEANHYQPLRDNTTTVSFKANVTENPDDGINTSNNLELNFWEFTSDTSTYVYSGLTLAVIVLSLIRSFTFFSICTKASVKLHDTMFDSLTRASMRFFSTNAPGRILNRCSKDMGFVDELLPVALVECTQVALSLLGTFIVIAPVNPWLLIPSIAICISFYLLAIFYLKTSLALKRLEGVTRSAVFTHISSSLQGLTTIRACGAEVVLQEEFDNHQDLHSSTLFSFNTTITTFGYWLDTLSSIYIAAITMSFFVIGNEEYGGNVGLAISQALALTGMLQWGIRQATEFQSYMTSVERVLEYTVIEQELPLDSIPDNKPADTWPERGEIKFVNLSYRYFPEDPPVLKNLTFTIHSLEKVGIVGRTGAGKSSLISALFRFVEPDGSILVDGIDIKDIGLHDLRSKISIIPQEPILFSGTLKKNLDPFEEYDDAVLWKALEEVELKQVVSDMAEGLETKITEGGANFSVGQRQLVCLARAILRNNKILVLDEATANVDPQTDFLIQQTIRNKFVNCTVLTIAHRLHTVMDSDKVLVMDNGTMVEYDHPHILLQNPSGVFFGMVQQTGDAMMDILRETAKTNYKLSHMKKNKF